MKFGSTVLIHKSTYAVKGRLIGGKSNKYLIELLEDDPKEPDPDWSKKGQTKWCFKGQIMALPYWPPELPVVKTE